MSTDRTITGIKNIAHELGVSERTAQRYAKAGKLKVAKIGGRTSPARMTESALKTFKAKMYGKRVKS